jgi:hypothetical protein
MEVSGMTDSAWMERLDAELESESLELAKARALEWARRKRMVTQRELEKLVEQREAIKDNWARKEEVWADMMAWIQEDYEFDCELLRAALEGGAVVECGELTLEDALTQERQMRLPFGPRLVYEAAG